MARVVLDAERLLTEVPYLDRAEVVRRAEHTSTCLVDRDGPVRVSFLGGLAPNRVRDPERVADTGVSVASLLDLAATKVQVVQTRASARDYVDVDALVHAGGTGLSQALGAAAAVFGDRFNPVLTLKALTFFGDGDLATIPAAVRERLAAAVRDIDLNRIPSLSARPGLYAARGRFMTGAARNAPELLQVARRVVWFKPPEETLRDPVLFLNHVMTWGTVDDIRVARSCFDGDDFRAALRQAYPGVFDPRSWAYWHVALGMEPTPPLPTRQLPE